jgi:hypothetical protein
VTLHVSNGHPVTTATTTNRPDDDGSKIGSVVRLAVAVGSNRPAVQVPNVVGS